MPLSGGSKLRRTLGVMLSVALVASSAAPAMAQSGRGGYNNGGWSQGWGGSNWRNDRYSQRPHRHYRNRDRGLNAGEVVGIAALIGAVAVIASSASKNSRKNTSPSRDQNTYPDYPASPQGNYDYSDNGAPYPSAPYPSGSYPAQPSSAWSSDAAIDACVSAARDKAENERGYAQILDVQQPKANGQNGWFIDGRVEQRSSYRSMDNQTRRFTCDVRGGQVAEVYLSRDVG